MKQELFRTIEQTKVIYSGQSIAPVSPGIEDNGEYQFCAAACLAYVGIKNKYGTHQSFEFVENLTAFNSKDTILTAFSKLGVERRNVFKGDDDK
jgi:methenyltetrahydromethanopterin cyclohydrolase